MLMKLAKAPEKESIRDVGREVTFIFIYLTKILDYNNKLNYKCSIDYYLSAPL